MTEKPLSELIAQLELLEKTAKEYREPHCVQKFGNALREAWPRLSAEIKKTNNELAELQYLFEGMQKLVIPGQFDSSDALIAKLKEGERYKREADLLREAISKFDPLFYYCAACAKTQEEYSKLIEALEQSDKLRRGAHAE